MKENLSNVIKAVKKAPQKKHHLDFIVAILTIPVLLSVIILNYSNLQKNKVTSTPTAIISPSEKIIVLPQKTTNSNPSPSESCIKDIGPISISFPDEGEIISDNPVCVNIKYTNSNYCSVVWSYRINQGTWSDFNSNNPCIYNAPNGDIKFDLRVQSTIIQKEVNLTRNFINKNSTIATSSATTQ